MQEAEILMRLKPFGGELLLLGVAVLLAIGFFGLLLFEVAKRRRRKRRHRLGAKGLREQLRAALSRMRAFQHEFERMLRHRARRHGGRRSKRLSSQQ